MRNEQQARFRLPINCLSVIAPEIFQAVRGAAVVNQQLNSIKQSSIQQVVVQYNLCRGNAIS
ncbi:hypothetical protein NC981_08795 [Leptolyngbya sp. DQ-M1]|uniref:hypothetical protein n=1 Tax=Leptolyngbya sp. DQ-M1 TaxID=2933920 RepID=UPI0032986CF9